MVIGGFVVALLASASTYDFYDRGFWEAGGLGAMDDIETLEKMYDQPLDYVLEYDSEWGMEGDIVTAKMSSEYKNALYQPTNEYIIDFLDINNHQNEDFNINKISTEGSILESFSNSENETSGILTITNMGLIVYL